MSGDTHEDNLRLLYSLIRLFSSLVKLSANSQDMFSDKEADVANTFFLWWCHVKESDALANKGTTHIYKLIILYYTVNCRCCNGSATTTQVNMLRFLLTNWKSSQRHWEFQSLWKTPMQTVHFEVRFFKILISAKQRRGQTSFMDLKTFFHFFWRKSSGFIGWYPRIIYAKVHETFLDLPSVCGLARFFISPYFPTMFGHATDWTFVYGRRCIWKLGNIPRNS